MEPDANGPTRRVRKPRAFEDAAPPARKPVSIEGFIKAAGGGNVDSPEVKEAPARKKGRRGAADFF